MLSVKQPPSTNASGVLAALPKAVLPAELKQQVFKHLDGQDLLSVTQVDRSWREVGLSPWTLRQQLNKAGLQPPRGADGTRKTASAATMRQMLVQHASLASNYMHNRLKLHCWLPRAHGVTAAAFSEDRRFIMTVDADRLLFVWDLAQASQQQLCSDTDDETLYCGEALSGYKGHINALALSYDGGIAAALDSVVGCVIIWNLKQTPWRCYQLPTHIDGGRAVCFNSDNPSLLTISGPVGTTQTWDLAQHPPVLSAVHAAAEECWKSRYITFSPDRRFDVRVGLDSAATVVDSAQVPPASVPLNNCGRIQDFVKFSQDGRLLLTDGYPLGVQVFDYLASGTQQNE
jgi:WD40 repeat protein